MIEEKGLQARQQEWKAAQAEVTRALVGDVPSLDLSNIPRGRHMSRWSIAIDVLFHELDQKLLAVNALNIASMEFLHLLLKNTDGKSDRETLLCAGHEIPRIGSLLGGGFISNRTSLCDEFRDGTISQLTKGIFNLYIRYAELVEPEKSIESTHRVMGNTELAQKEAERTKGTTRKERFAKYVGTDTEGIEIFYENANREFLPSLNSFRAEYSSQLVPEEQRLQEVLRLATSVQRLWAPRGV
jgi:hypothetical protein